MYELLHTLIGALVGAGVAVWKLSVTHKQEREQQAREHKEERERQACEHKEERYQQVRDRKIEVYSRFLGDCARALRASSLRSATVERTGLAESDQLSRDSIEAFLESTYRCQVLTKELRDPIRKLLKEIESAKDEGIAQEQIPERFGDLVMGVVNEMCRQLDSHDSGIEGNLLLHWASLLNPNRDDPDRERSNGFVWLNSCERDFHREMLDNGVACTYGDDKYRRKLEKVNVGDRIFLYRSGHGIIAMGRVKAAARLERVETRVGLGNTYTSVTEEIPEHSVPVDWDTIFVENPIQPFEIREAGNDLFLPTVIWLDDKVGKRLEEIAQRRNTS